MAFSHKVYLDLEPALVAITATLALGMVIAFVFMPNGSRIDPDFEFSGQGRQIMTDCVTGVQYLVRYGGGIAARLSSEGELMHGSCEAGLGEPL